MRRIFNSFFVLTIILTIASSAAFAILTGEAQLNGISFSTGNANLQISRDKNNWSTDVTSGINFENITPGWSKNYEIFVKNSGKTNLILNLKGEFQQNWEDQSGLRGIIKIHVLEFNNSNEQIHDFGERTLSNIADESGEKLNLNQLDKEEVRKFVLEFSVPDNLKQEYQNQNMSGIDFIFEGFSNSAS